MEHKDRKSLDDVGDALPDVEKVLDVGFRHLRERQASERIGWLEQIGHLAADERQKPRDVYLLRHDVPALRPIPVRL